MKNNGYIAWFDGINKHDVNTVGGKGANLGEMFQNRFPVPFGFVVTSAAYFDFIKEKKLYNRIKEQLKLLNHHDPNQLNQTAKAIQKIILTESVPESITRQIMFAYLDLPRLARKKQHFLKKISSLIKYPLVAIRSSATAEDLPGASFAGQ